MPIRSCCNIGRESESRSWGVRPFCTLQAKKERKKASPVSRSRRGGGLSLAYFVCCPWLLFGIKAGNGVLSFELTAERCLSVYHEEYATLVRHSLCSCEHTPLALRRRPLSGQDYYCQDGSTPWHPVWLCWKWILVWLGCPAIRQRTHRCMLQ